MSPQSEPESPDYPYEAMQFRTLSRRFTKMMAWEEPPKWSRTEHNEWSDAWESFHTAVAHFQEEMDDRIKEWES